MTVHVSLASEKDSSAWNAFVAGSPVGHLLQSYQWGVFKAHFGWEPMRFMVRDGEHILGGAQVLFRRLLGPGPLRPLAVSIAYVPRGPVVAPGDEDTLATLLSAIHQAARRAGAVFLKIEPHWPNDPALAAWLVQHGFQISPQTIQPRRTILVDLQPAEDEWLAAMKPKTRYNIRLAARKGVVVRQGAEEDLDAFYRLLQETRRRDGFAIHSRAYYDLAWRTFASPPRPLPPIPGYRSGQALGEGQGVGARLLVAEHEGQVLAGIMVFALGPVATYLYGASSGQHRHLMPNYLLQWEAMRWARERGCQTYDLWGIPDEDEEVLESRFLDQSEGLWGVYRFKRGFGGRVTRYVGAFDYVYRPQLYWLWARAIPRLRARRNNPPIP